ncbi:MAG: branched-chain amino acid ABC transporter ATP-binding protein/permease [Pseudorhodoplanes sp.]|nr:branched-chain amino acid ABC transporter ATP-binding protein/permease [Pseudorhodoplanes sp.]
MSKYQSLIGFALLAVVLAVVPLTAANEYELRLFMLFLIYAVVALGLNILVGLAGLISLGQAGLFALGAYTAAILSTRLGFELVSSSIAAIIVASLFGALLAYPTVRVRGVYLAVITIAFGLIVENAAIEWQGLTGGPMGITGIPKPSILGIALTGYAYYAVLAGVLVLVVIVTHNLKRSKYGRAMLAVSQSETAARSLGINATGIRTLAFVISAATAGLAGVLYAFLNSYISPDIFTFSDSIRFLLMVIFGGAGTTTGTLIGAYILTYLPEYLQQFQYWQKFAYGLLLAVVMFVLPLGVFGTLSELWRKWRPQPRRIEAAGLPLEEALAIGKVADRRPTELKAEGLTVRFGGLTALSDVSLCVRPAEIHALIGPNGAGKSTFVNTISGFYRPDSGRYALNGVDITGQPPHLVARSGLARTFQNTELFGDLTVLDNVMVGYQNRFSYNFLDACIRTPRFRREEEQCRAAALGLLKFVDLEGYANERARFLPFGLQRRLEIARALATSARLLLLDEPAAGLTTHEIEELDKMIRRIAALGISVLLIEHHVELIMAVADQVTVLDYGVVIASAPPDIVQEDPKVIEAYFGTHGASAEAAS